MTIQLCKRNILPMQKYARSKKQSKKWDRMVIFGTKAGLFVFFISCFEFGFYRIWKSVFLCLLILAGF
jgi:hypothetical protein